MLPQDKIKAYVGLVCEQIRWKKARVRVGEEMEQHISDQRDSWIAQGLEEETATEKAIADTGDAIAIGSQLDRTHRPKPQWAMLGATAALLVLGILIRLFVFNDSDRVGSLTDRLVFTGIGIAGMLIAYCIDFSLLGRYPKIVYFTIVAIGAATLFLSPVIYGRAYYAQYVILLFPLAFAVVIFAARDKGYIGLIVCELAFGLLGVLALAIPFVFGFMHIAFVGVVLLCVALWKNWFGITRLYGFLLTFAPIVIFIMVFFVNNSHWSRLAIAINPSLEPLGTGYWGVVTRELLSGAKLFGRGIVPIEYVGYITEPTPTMCSELLLTALIVLFGWIAFTVVMGTLLFFTIKGFILCFKQKSSLGHFVSLSILMTLAAQVIGYAAYNLGFQLAPPISLPLISHGNTATVINLVLIGFMLSVFRTGDAVTDGKPSATQPMENKFITWDDSKMTIRFKPQQR